MANEHAAKVLGDLRDLWAKCQELCALEPQVERAKLDDKQLDHLTVTLREVNNWKVGMWPQREAIRELANAIATGNSVDVYVRNASIILRFLPRVEEDIGVCRKAGAVLPAGWAPTPPEQEAEAARPQ
ncbi:MAG: hypothetical protein K8I02_08935 [Candidatus Methylomirabilis sp.]|nr:hypothetical protein [Deltaproteobacteria bacterium]